MVAKGPKPLFLTPEDISDFYSVDSRALEEIIETLDPSGWYGTKPMFTRHAVEAKIKEINK